MTWSRAARHSSPMSKAPDRAAVFGRWPVDGGQHAGGRGGSLGSCNRPETSHDRGARPCVRSRWPSSGDVGARTAVRSRSSTPRPAACSGNRPSAGRLREQSLAFSPDGGRSSRNTAGRSGFSRRAPAASGSKTRSARGERDASDILPGGRGLLTASDDGTVRHWDARAAAGNSEPSPTSAASPAWRFRPTELASPRRLTDRERPCRCGMWRPAFAGTSGTARRWQRHAGAGVLVRRQYAPHV